MRVYPQERLRTIKLSGGQDMNAEDLLKKAKEVRGLTDVCQNRSSLHIRRILLRRCHHAIAAITAVTAVTAIRIYVASNGRL